MPDINTEKVCFVIVKARELESEDEGLEPDAANPSGDKFVSVTTDDAHAPVRAELAAAIDAMDEDEQCELVALAWIGRGEFTAEEWLSAVAQARGGAGGRRPVICSKIACSPRISNTASPNSTKAARGAPPIGSKSASAGGGRTGNKRTPGSRAPGAARR